LFVLCERGNNGSERQKQECCSESGQCFHCYNLKYRLGEREANSCVVLTAFLLAPFAGNLR
jgi:hypothetical protein